MLRLAGNTGVQNDILFTNASDVLTLNQGGLLRSNNAAGSLIGTATIPGILTTPASELIVYTASTGAPTGTYASGAGTNTIALTGAVATTITPGMVVSGTGILPGTYVTAVTNGGTTTPTVTLSNPTGSGTTGALTFTTSTTINARITGGAAFIKSGAGIVTLTNANKARSILGVSARAV
jgi:hypothetical protein